MLGPGGAADRTVVLGAAIGRADDQRLAKPVAQRLQLVEGDVADLIKRSDAVNGLKFIITTHSPLFFNVLFNELKKKTSYMLKRLEDGTFELTEKNGDSNQSFSYHLYLKQTLEEAIAADKIERYHFTLLRNLYEKTSNFLGYPRWSELLPGDQQLYLP